MKIRNPHKEAYYEEGGILGYSDERTVSMMAHKKIVKERNKLLEEKNAYLAALKEIASIDDMHWPEMLVPVRIAKEAIQKKNA